MNETLMNSDQSVNNFGWRITEKGKEIVVFDLTDIYVGPRFFDISVMMQYELADSVVPYEEMGAHYLTVYNKLSGESVTEEEFFDEVTWILDRSRYRHLDWGLEEWLSGKVDWTDDISSAQRRAR